MPRRRPARERFWEKVRIVRGPGCWEWTANRRYGRAIFAEKRRTWSAARWLMTQRLGRPLRNDEFCCHHCDNPACVRPSHLYLGTHAQNQADKKRRSRARGGRKGLTPEDVAEIRAARVVNGRPPKGGHGPGVTSLAKLAERFNVTAHTIWMIRAGKLHRGAGGRE